MYKVTSLARLSKAPEPASSRNSVQNQMILVLWNIVAECQVLCRNQKAPFRMVTCRAQHAMATGFNPNS